MFESNDVVSKMLACAFDCVPSLVRTARVVVDTPIVDCDSVSFEHLAAILASIALFENTTDPSSATATQAVSLV